VKKTGWTHHINGMPDCCFAGLGNQDLDIGRNCWMFHQRKKNPTSMSDLCRELANIEVNERCMLVGFFWLLSY